MPLAFPSLSHGTVAFGFFNIESDMLLLQQNFFFADHFCRLVLELAAASKQAEAELSLPGWRIDEPGQMGNVNTAIAGVDQSGFIGATYQAYPFPRQQEGFKQKPYGIRNQAEFARLIENFGQSQTHKLHWQGAEQIVTLAGIRFEREAFLQLIHYVDRGGYPRWLNEERPDYVQAMMDGLANSFADSFI